MRLIRCGAPGRERPGVLLDDGGRLDTSAFTRDYDESFFADGGVDGLRAWLSQHGDTAPRIPAGERLGPPIRRPSKIICIGLNFRDHAAESGMEVPREPVLFLKATSALCGPNDDVIIPRGGTKLDWEVEPNWIHNRRPGTSPAARCTTTIPNAPSSSSAAGSG